MPVLLLIASLRSFPALILCVCVVWLHPNTLCVSVPPKAAMVDEAVCRFDPMTVKERFQLLGNMLSAAPRGPAESQTGKCLSSRVSDEMKCLSVLSNGPADPLPTLEEFLWFHILSLYWKRSRKHVSLTPRSSFARHNKCQSWKTKLDRNFESKHQNQRR